MVAARVHRPTPRAGGHAPHPEAVLARLDPDAEGAQRIGHGLDPVRFLLAELGGAADDALAARHRRREREERQLVDHPRAPRRADLGRDELGVLDLDVGDRLAARGGAVVERDPRAHALEDVQQAGAGRVDADACDAAAASRAAASRRRGTGRPRRSRPGSSSRSGSSRSAGRTSTCPGRGCARARRPRAASARCGRASGRARPPSSGRPRRAAPRAGRTTSPARSRRGARSASGVSARPSMRSGRPPPVVSTVAPICVSGSAIRPIGRGDSDSSPTSSKRLPSWPARMPGDEPNERAGVAAVDRPLRLAQPAQAHARDAHGVPALPHLDAERADGGDRRLGVGGAAEALDHGLAVGDRAEQHRAMRDRLVAGHGDAALHRPRRIDPHSPARARPTRRSPAPRAAAPPARPPTRRRPGSSARRRARARSAAARSPRC